MKNFLVLILVLCMISLPSVIHALNIAVLSFSNDTGNSYNPYYKYGDYIADHYEEDLISKDYIIPNLNVISRMDLEQVINEQNLDFSGRFDTKGIMKIGKISGVKYIVIGSISSISVDISPWPRWGYCLTFSVSVRVKIINTTSGNIIYSNQLTHSMDELIRYTTRVGPQFHIKCIKLVLWQITQHLTAYDMAKKISYYENR